MGRRKYFKGFIILCIIGIFILVGCSKIEPVAVVKNKKEQLSIGSSIPKSLEVSNDISTREEDIICALFDGLVEITEGGDIGPLIVKGWKVSVDGLTYSLILREDAYWSDGEKIIADDFIEFFSDILSPENKEYTSDELFTIFGAEEYKKGIKSFDEIGITSTSDTELKFRLVTKDDDFLRKLTKPEYRLRDLDDNLRAYKENYEEIRYTGAYRVLSMEEGILNLTKNIEYTGEFLGAKDIQISGGADYIKDFAMYNTGKLDIAYNPPKSAFDDGKLLSKINVGKSSIIDYMVFNGESEISKYLDFRKAIYIGLSNSLNESYMIKNNLARSETREVTSEEIEKNIFFEDEFKKVVVSSNVSSGALEVAENYLSTIPNIKTEEIRVVGVNNFENRSLEIYLKDIFEKLGLILEFKLYKTDEINSIVDRGEFEILLDSVDLNEDNINNRVGKVLSKFEDSEFTVISLYRRNNYWCRSDRVENIYVDLNGNLILRKSIYKN
ncbi:ABC transporter substrate-binding protein [uncultured Clostridium sp.]|uniref:ABC transporter substrate-binding protein n=1 Tax=uncultured Clostridium sp. TaxID=59620 RepID=UPI0026199AAA|nr:ABC transporter substrate-binding protein [uncultured Clostridium sp.]